VLELEAKKTELEAMVKVRQLLTAEQWRQLRARNMDPEARGSRRWREAFVERVEGAAPEARPGRPSGISLLGM
jgi:hypothetical protein